MEGHSLQSREGRSHSVPSNGEKKGGKGEASSPRKRNQITLKKKEGEASVKIRVLMKKGEFIRERKMSNEEKPKKDDKFLENQGRGSKTNFEEGKEKEEDPNFL